MGPVIPAPLEGDYFMPIIARTTEKRLFVPPSQRKDKEPFGVWIRPDGKTVQIQIENIRSTLGISEDAETEADVKAELANPERKFSFAWEYLRIFLCGWENVVGDAETLTPVEFVTSESGQPTDETIAKIEIGVRAEIFAELTGTTELSKGERKNSA